MMQAPITTSVIDVPLRFSQCARMLTHDEILRELVRQTEETKVLTKKEVARRLGVAPPRITEVTKGDRRIQPNELPKLAALLGMAEHSGRPVRTIPWLGRVPAGKFRPAEHEGGRRFTVSDPETPPNAYALTIEGDSMDLVVPNGATIVIDPDDKQLWPGRRYVVQTEDGETTYKEFQADPARLVPCSSNPDHQEIPLGDQPITVLGRVFSYTMRDVPRRRP